ncbi:hypothetical protein JTB14_035560 [Gonioctena quinquepunctata]|nr:hypothetical protein JTB14_035560 [Gonioctena quinquepunctata]
MFICSRWQWKRSTPRPGTENLVYWLERERPPQGRVVEDPALEQAAGSPVPAIGEIGGKPRHPKRNIDGKTVKLKQANLQHAKAASYIIRRFANELLDVALIQPWTTGPGRINCLGNIPDLCSEDVVAAQLTVPTEEGQLKDCTTDALTHDRAPLSIRPTSPKRVPTFQPVPIIL